MIVRIADAAVDEPQAEEPIDLTRLGAIPPSWTLQRRRRLRAVDAAVAKRIRTLLAPGRVTATALTYAGETTPVRPGVAKLLQFLFAGQNHTYSVADVCQVLYGRPGTLRSVRQVVFRVNRAMERVNCPLVLHCQALSVFLRPKPQRFGAATPQAAERLARLGLAAKA